MARAIYEIKLKYRMFPAQSAADALEMQKNGDLCEGIAEDDVEVSEVVSEEDALKLMVLAATMYDTGVFSDAEVQTAVESVIVKLGYLSEYKEIADCVITWVERLCDGMTVTEIKEWMIG